MHLTLSQRFQPDELSSPLPVDVQGPQAAAQQLEMDLSHFSQELSFLHNSFYTPV